MYMYIYVILLTKYISNLLCPIWKYTHKGFPPPHPTPPHPMPGPSTEGPGVDGAWGWVGWGESLMVIFPYWILDILFINLMIIVNIILREFV